MRSISRTACCLGAVLTGVLTVGSPADSDASATHPKRKIFLGHPDPKGYRCRFTLAADWQSGDNRDLRHGPVEGQIDRTTLAPKDWTRSAPGPGQIALQTFGKSLLPGDVSLRTGYPEPTGWRKDQLITHRHLSIDGCPATVIKAGWADGGRHYHETEFYVYVPGRSILYLLHTVPVWPEYDWMDREMQAIIRTFHVEQVAPATNRMR